MQLQNRIEAKLQLINGLEFQGYSFGYMGPADGETVFSTAMVGYPESLTDPSYSGQMLCITYPLIGNYGVPRQTSTGGISDVLESEKIWVRGLIISDYSFDYSHWSAVESLDEWLKSNRIPGIYGIDTRSLTQVLRENGSMLGRIIQNGAEGGWDINDPNKVNQVAVTSCKEVTIYGAGEGKKKIVVIDCGIKHNILRCFLKRDVEIIRVPWNYDFNDGSIGSYDGLFISNGPGNPEFCGITEEHIRATMALCKPVFGICMGNQLLARASGAKTYKLKYGHRSHNQPVRLVGTTKCYVTSQNHGYAVDDTTLPADWKPLFVNMNDGTNEGIKHVSKPFFSVQFHPEASSGPTDTEFLFDEFIKML
ncbi:MAG: glutamine-hydrolyzing carbamoyl-phosphate synthase small subunit [Bacteroidales bacterium]|jgi:carbamoyl-phosphate synthase small subunit|nr:glutamine-hydrolyzing carbamoyl-phosphate synthase small subunit [Bacteroidales bacterium]MCI2121157.1 glutamine-hydrolyzing carbamoyl-phosphate synthase small subunit [Bacteroidales bacterium]MCI2144746.1 glutamine-hydrolyzing carbamoyl-phosphate synthase small subunit [Bacteroidales bacterium]